MIQYMFGVVAFGDKQYKIIPGEACIFDRIAGENGNSVQGVLAKNGEKMMGEKMAKQETNDQMESTYD